METNLYTTFLFLAHALYSFQTKLLPSLIFLKSQGLWFSLHILTQKKLIVLNAQYKKKNTLEKLQENIEREIYC